MTNDNENRCLSAADTASQPRRKILFIDVGMHAKNRRALQSYTRHCDIVFVSSSIDYQEMEGFEVIYSPAVPFNVAHTPPSVKLCIFGPHFSVFPEAQSLSNINARSSATARPAVVYIQPSDWAAQTWKTLMPTPLLSLIPIETLPFAVDTARFAPLAQPFAAAAAATNNKPDAFIYVKGRHPADVAFVQGFLHAIDLKYTVFCYNSKYDEQEYIDCLQRSRFGIWIGTHESQGFALQEALSCNVPLLVWNAVSMSQEFQANYKDIPSTTIPYWDDSLCGAQFTHAHQLAPTFHKFLKNIHTFRPREFVLNHLTSEICEQKLLALIDKYVIR